MGKFVINTYATPANWFDILVVVFLLIGLLVGRKRGLSGEILGVLEWLTILVAGSRYYPPMGAWIVSAGQVTPNFANISAYVILLIATVGLFAGLRRLLGQKLLSGENFGRADAPLGMLAGAARHGCVVIAVLALVNAPHFSPAELAAQQQSFGSGSRPTPGRLHQEVAHESLTSHIVHRHLPTLLIQPVDPAPAPARESLGRRREQELNRLMK